MAAAATDKFKKLSRRWVGQIGAGGVSDASVTTIPLASTTNLATDTAVVAVIDRVSSIGTTTASFEETVIGVVSGSNLVNCVRGAEGTAQSHSAGAVVEILVTAKGINDIIDGILQDHSQLGYHKSLKDANGNNWLSQNAVASAVNYIMVGNAITASSPSVCATGTDTNVPLALYGKGSGGLDLNGVVVSKTAPSSGQVLTATSSSAAGWATPSSSAAKVDEDDAGGSSTSSATAAAITGADVSVTTTATTHIVVQAFIQAYANPGAAAGYGIQFHDGTSLVGVEMRTDLIAGNRRQVIPVQFIKQNAIAGTYTFTVYHRSLDGATSCTAEAINVIAHTIPA